MLLATPVFSMDGSWDYDEGIFSYVLDSKAAQYLAQSEESFDSQTIRSRPVRVDFKRIFNGTGKDNLGNQNSW